MAEKLLFCSGNDIHRIKNVIDRKYRENNVVLDSLGCHVLKNVHHTRQYDRYNNEKISYGEVNIPSFLTMCGEKSNKTKIGAHIVQYFLHSGLVPWKGDIDISHRCHQPRCLNYKHLSREPHSINEDRKACKANQICSGHVDSLGFIYDKCIFKGKKN